MICPDAFVQCCDLPVPCITANNSGSPNHPVEISGREGVKTLVTVQKRAGQEAQYPLPGILIQGKGEE